MNEVTTNYGLYVTDDLTEKFADWRDRMGGTQDSNMVKIDRALGEKADHSRVVEAVLLASAWTETDASFMQELSVEGLLEDTNGVIGMAQDASVEVREVVRNAMLAVAEQKDGVLTVVADGALPEMDIPVCIILFG